MAYGRTRTASKGPGIDYNVGAKSAQSFLEPGESSQYMSALETMGRGRPSAGQGRGNSWSGSRQHVSKVLRRDRLQRHKAERQGSELRNVAATRALGEFHRGGMQTSKPWLRKASEGLITGQSVTAPIDTSKLYWTRKAGPGAKDRMTKNQKRRVGDIAKYTNFQYGAIGVPGQAVRSNMPADAPLTSSPQHGDPANAPWTEGLTDQAVQDILNQNVPGPSSSPATSTTSPPVDTGGGEETGTALQDLIDQIHKDNLAGLGGG